MRAPFRRLAAALLLVAAPFPAMARPVAHSLRGHAAHPALWKVSDRDTTLWLLGTIHALPPHFEWETPLIRQAIQRADRLVLEAVIDREHGDAAEALMRLGTARAPLPPIEDRVAPAYRTKLIQMAGKSGVPIAALNRLKTWAAGMVLFGVTVSGLGVSSADGVEERLKAQFGEAHKPIEGLETVDQQLGFFDAMGEAQQREFLQSVVDDAGEDPSDFGKMLGAWSHGDERAIRASFDRDMKGTAALRDVLIVRRNRRWADLLAQRLKTPGTQFVAVGAGHLVGPGSVQSILAARGFTVRRVE